MLAYFLLGIEGKCYIFRYGKRKKLYIPKMLSAQKLYIVGERRIAMNDFGINEMLEMQKTLQEKYKDKWEMF